MATSGAGRLANSIGAAAAAAIDVVVGRASLIGLPGAASRALEYGCGIGPMTAALSEHFAEVVGVDPSADRIDSAQLMYRGRARCRFIVGGLSVLAGFPASFGLAYADLSHNPSVEGGDAVADALLTTLVPGGIAAIKLPSGAEQQVAEGVSAAGGRIAWLESADSDSLWLYAVAAHRRLRLLADPAQQNKETPKRAMA